MAQDFAKRSRSRATKPSPSRFSLGSFVLGVITGVGLFLAGAYGPELLNARSEQIAKTTKTGNDADPTANSTDPTEKQLAPEAPSVEFVFRDLLGEDEVDPDLSAYESEIQVARKTTLNQTPQAVNFLLQSGSFQIKADAESRRGSLLLLNMPANIVEARIDNKIWYRVIVGPYTQRGQAQQAVARLKANNITSIWMERPVAEG